MSLYNNRKETETGMYGFGPALQTNYKSHNMNHEGKSERCSDFHFSCPYISSSNPSSMLRADGALIAWVLKVFGRRDLIFFQFVIKVYAYFVREISMNTHFEVQWISLPLMTNFSQSSSVTLGYILTDFPKTSLPPVHSPTNKSWNKYSKPTKTKLARVIFTSIIRCSFYQVI